MWAAMDRIEFTSSQIEITKKRMLHELLLVRHTFFLFCRTMNHLRMIGHDCWRRLPDDGFGHNV